MLTAVFAHFQWPSARRLAWTAAIVQCLALPIFTPLGLFGIILLWRGAFQDDGLPKSPPAKIGAFWGTVTALVALILAAKGFTQWAHALGYPEKTGPSTGCTGVVHFRNKFP